MIFEQTNPSQRPKAAGGGTRRALYSTDLDTMEQEEIPTFDGESQTSLSTTQSDSQDDWLMKENENLMNLVMNVAEEQALNDAIIHRSVTCNHCGMSPLRGWRFV